MNDVATKNPVRVKKIELSKVGPYIWVSVNQVKEVETLLRKHNIFFWTEEDSLSINNGPYMTYVHFRLGQDPNAVQAILDSES